LRGLYLHLAWPLVTAAALFVLYNAQALMGAVQTVGAAFEVDTVYHHMYQQEQQHCNLASLVRVQVWQAWRGSG